MPSDPKPLSPAYEPSRLEDALRALERDLGGPGDLPAHLAQSVQTVVAAWQLGLQRHRAAYDEFISLRPELSRRVSGYMLRDRDRDTELGAIEHRLRGLDQARTSCGRLPQARLAQAEAVRSAALQWIQRVREHECAIDRCCQEVMNRDMGVGD